MNSGNKINEKKVGLSYSRITLIPVNPKKRLRYLEYTRTQVREVSKVFMVGIFLLVIVTFGIAFNSKSLVAFRKEKTLDPILVYFVFLASLLIIIISCFFLSFKWQCILDLVCPLFGVVVFLVCIPAW